MQDSDSEHFGELWSAAGARHIQGDDSGAASPELRNMHKRYRAFTRERIVSLHSSITGEESSCNGSPISGVPSRGKVLEVPSSGVHQGSDARDCGVPLEASKLDDEPSWMRSAALPILLHAPADHLQSVIRTRRGEACNVALATAFSTACPISAILTHRYFQMVLLFVAVLHATRGTVGLIRTTGRHEPAFAQFRFVVTEFRNGSRPMGKMPTHSHRRDNDQEGATHGTQSGAGSLMDGVGAEVDVGSSVVTGFAMLQDGCPIAPLETAVGDSWVAARYASPVRVNGFTFRTTGDTGGDPVKFLVLGGEHWEQQVVGASGGHRTSMGSLMLHDLWFATPEARGEVVEVDQRMTGVMAINALVDFVWATGLVAGAWLGRSGSELMGKELLRLTLLSVGGLMVGAGATDEEARQRVTWLMEGGFLLGLLVVLSTRPRWAGGGLLVAAAVAFIVLDAVINAVVHEHALHLIEAPPLMAVFVSGAGLFFLVFGARSKRLAELRVLPDAAAYDALWRALHQHHPAALPALRSTCSRLQYRAEAEAQAPGPLRQCNRTRYLRPLELGTGSVGSSMTSLRRSATGSFSNASSNGLRWTALKVQWLGRMCEWATTAMGYRRRGWMPESLRYACFGYPETVPLTLDEQSPVISLDQLYFQAMLVEPALRTKVQRLAGASRGKVRMAPEYGAAWELWERVEGDAGKELLVAWPPLKKVERAIAKLTRVYEDEVARLLDVCRQTLVFEAVEDMVTCLEEIERDEELLVMRVRNRLDAAHGAEEARQWAGFRSVNVSLRVATADTTRLGADTHVCELLLVLDSFASAMQDEAQQRYLGFRDLHRPTRWQWPDLLAPWTLPWPGRRRPGAGNARDAGISIRMATTAASRPLSSHQHTLLSESPVSIAPPARMASIEISAPLATDGELRDAFAPESGKPGIDVIVEGGRDAQQTRSPEGPALEWGGARGAPDRSGGGVSEDSSAGRWEGGRKAEEGGASEAAAEEEVVEEVVEEAGSGVEEREESGSRQGTQRGEGSRQERVEEEEEEGGGEGGAGGAGAGASRARGWDAAGHVRGRLAQAVEASVRNRASVEGGFFQRMLEAGYALKTATVSSVLFTSRPVAAGMCYWQWQLVLLLVSLFVYYRSYSFLQVWLSLGPMSYKHVRFTALETRGGGVPQTPGIAAFGVLLNGCVVEVEANRTRVHNASVDVSVEEGQPLDGFYLRTAHGDAALDPVRFEVLGSNDGERWDKIGAPAARVEDDGTVRLLEQRREPTLERGAVVAVDLRVRWPWVVFFVSAMPVGLSCNALLVKGVLLRFAHANLILCLGFACAIIAVHVSAFGWLSLGMWEECVFNLLFALGLAFVAFLVLAEQHLVRVIGLVGLYWCLIDVARNTLLYPDLGALWGNPPFSGIVLSIVWSLAILLRRAMLRHAIHLVHQDERLYDACWEDLLSRPRAAEDMAALAALVSRLAAASSSADARQLSHVDFEASIPHLVSASAHRRPLLSSSSGSMALLPPPLRHSASLSAPRALRRAGSRADSNPLPSNPTRSRDDLDAVLPRVPSPHLSLTASVPASASSITASSLYLLRSARGSESSELTPAAAVHPLSMHTHLHTAFSRPCPSPMPLPRRTPRPVDSLDQLYAQAAVLDPLLRARVQGWALASRGMVRMTKTWAERGGVFHCWAEVAGDPVRRRHVKWGKLKGVERAIEKVTRSYREEVSRLVDVCRQMLVFAEVADLTACLAEIEKDEDIAVLRVKNRLDPAYDGKQTGGFRNVSLNIQIKSAEASALGLEGHVCEVQLVLEAFARALTDAGHDRYVLFRNARGE